MPVLTIFIPAAGRAAFLGVDPGSAIVGMLKEGSERVLVHFEGNRYGAENLKRFDERVEHAAGRLIQNYPTIAKASLAVTDLAAVGTYDSESRAILVYDSETLARWAGEIVTSGRTAAAIRREDYERAKRVMRTGRF